MKAEGKRDFDVFSFFRSGWRAWVGRLVRGEKTVIRIRGEELPMFTLQFGGKFETLMDNSLTKGVGSPRHARPEQPRLAFPSLPLAASSPTPPSLPSPSFPPSKNTHALLSSPALSHMRSCIDYVSCASLKICPISTSRQRDRLRRT